MALPKNPGRTALAVTASLSMLASIAAFAQQSSPGSSSTPPTANTQSQTDQGRKPASSTGGGSSSNPFPVAQSQAAAKAAAQQDQTPPQNSSTPLNSPAAGNGAAGQKKPTPSAANPFPEAQSAAAARAANGGSGQPANAPAGSSSSGYSSSNANLPPAELGQGSLGSHSKLDSFTRDQTQDGRVEDDLKVADFYMKNGNYRGALDRYHDALRYDPQDDQALFGVAEATCKQNRTAEAMTLFQSYATNNPQGKYALKAEKTLAHPGKCKHNF